MGKRKSSVNKQPKKLQEETNFVVRRSSYLRAVKIIKEKDMKLHPLDNFLHTRKMIIKDNCCHDINILNSKRQNPNVLITLKQQLFHQIKQSISMHEWDSAIRCIKCLFTLTGNISTTIWKSLFVILLNHPRATENFIKDFLQMILTIRTTTEQETFIKTILTLPDDIRKYNSGKNSGNLNSSKNIDNISLRDVKNEETD